MDFKNKRVTVMGLGSFGGQVAAIHFLAGCGAREIIVTDTKPAEALGESLAQIAGLNGITLRLGGHVESDFTTVDAVVVSPAVPKSAPLLAVARKAGVALTSEMNLFFERCSAPARIVGITGSAGKSTTTAMIEAVLATATNVGRVFVGGNIGHRALLPRVGEIGPGDTVVLELSSFQLEDLGELKRSPHVAIVTNIAPNHLDRHGTMAEYVRCKQNILRFQQPTDFAILNGDDAALADWAGLTRGQVRWYRAAEAAGLDLQVVGRHNRLNAAAAMAVGAVLGVPQAIMAAALATFRALPHRLERVGQINGVRYFNDSKATTPESTRIALDAFADENAPVILIVGGYDKKIDIEPLCRDLARRAKAVITIGQTGPKFAEGVARHRVAGSPAGQVFQAGQLAAAVKLAMELAAPGDAVVLSPASASFDQFANYEERGRAFVDLVAAAGP